MKNFTIFLFLVAGCQFGTGMSQAGDETDSESDSGFTDGASSSDGDDDGSSPAEESTGMPADPSSDGGDSESDESEESSSGEESGEAPPMVLPMVPVAMGTYTIGCSDQDASCEADEFPRHNVYLSSFSIAEHETTVAEYTSCVDAGACEAAGDASFDPICNFGDDGKGDHPINCVTWQDATDFCAWIGGSLPTESQWEAAARGNDGRLFPWGNESVSCDRAIVVTNGMGCGTGETWPVGSKPDGVSPFGALDMTGNVSEWVADWYSPEAYEEAEGETDPQGPLDGIVKNVRGGSLHNGQASSLRVGNRTFETPATAAYWIGFRCVLPSE